MLLPYLENIVDCRVKFENSDILFSRRLLRFCQSRCSVYADYETSRYFGIQSTRVTSFLDFQNSLDPCNDLMGRRVGRLVQVYTARFDVL